MRLAIVLSRIAQVIHRPGGVGESVLATVATLHLYDLSIESIWCYRCSEAQLTACFRENQLAKRTANERHVQTLLRNRKNLHDLQFETVFYRFEPV